MSDSSKVFIREGATRLLVVEGTHEKDLVEQLIVDRSIDASDLQILPIGGKNQLQAGLRALKNDSRFSDVVGLGIVRDADSLPADRESPMGTTAAQLARDAVLGCLRNAGLPVPAGGLGWTPGRPRVGLLILPDGVRDGMLETLCREPVSSRPEVPCVDAYFDCLKQNSLRDDFMEKAWTQVFVAGQTEPDLPLGRAAKKGYWDLRHAAFDMFATFLQFLMDIPAVVGDTDAPGA